MEIMYYKAMTDPDLSETGYFTRNIYFKVNDYPYLFRCLNWLVKNKNVLPKVMGVAETAGFSIPVEITKEEFDERKDIEWGGFKRKSLVINL